MQIIKFLFGIEISASTVEVNAVRFVVPTSVKIPTASVSRSLILSDTDAVHQL